MIAVPNAPCGVESKDGQSAQTFHPFVPNAPCGVEREALLLHLLSKIAFLMHRVELKAQ